MLGRAHARELQDVRRADRAGGEDDFTFGVDTLHGSVALVLDCDGAAAVEHDTVNQRLSNDLQVRALHCRAQISPGRAGSPPTAARLLAPPDAVRGAGWQVVHILTVFEADFLAGFDYRRAQRRMVHLRCKERTPLPAN